MKKEQESHPAESGISKEAKEKIDRFCQDLSGSLKEDYFGSITIVLRRGEVARWSNEQTHRFE